MWDHSVDQVYIEHLRAEHLRIQQAARSVERELQVVPDHQDAERVLTALTSLRRTMVQHFEEEDRGGCLEEAISRCPSLSAEAALIEREHPRLLQLIDRLIERVHSGSMGCTTADFVESFQRFAKTLYAHETGENRILERAFGTVVCEEARGGALRRRSQVMVKKILILTSVVFALGSLVQLNGRQPTDAGAFMRAKLDHSQEVLAGLATEDYSSLRKHAGSLTLLSQDTDWHVLQTAEYRRLSDDFRRHTRALTRAAERKNLDGATLSYVQMTLTCIECHKHVRHVRRQAKEKLPPDKNGG